MPYLSTITVMGHLGRGVEMKETSSGKAMAKTVVAVNTGWGDNKTTTWWNLTVFGPQAEWLARDGTKGALVAVIGEPEVRTFDKQDGTKGWSAEILAREVRVIDRQGQPGEAQPQSAPVREAPATGGGMPDDEPPFMPYDY